VTPDAGVEPFELQFDIGTIKHLGLQMYSTLPPVVAELVANSWDAEATEVAISIPTGRFRDDSEIVVVDDGTGMTDAQVRQAFLKVGRDRRSAEGSDLSEGVKLDEEHRRPVMGRKGIGKFCGFGVARQIEIESVRDGEHSRFVMDYRRLEERAAERVVAFDPLPATGLVNAGTRVTLRDFARFRSRGVAIGVVRRGLARRFSVIGGTWGFSVVVNDDPITADERDLTRLLDVDALGVKYLWTFDDEVAENSGWRVTGWIGALRRTIALEDGIQRGVAILARGKLVQEPFTFDAVVGQQFALSYLIGELHAEFVDADEDTVGTSRNQLVWDTDANQALMEWGRKTVNRLAREWAERRARDNESTIQANPLYQRFRAEAVAVGNQRALKVADKLIRESIARNVVADADEQEAVVQLCLDFLEFDAFWELAEELNAAAVDDPLQLMRLFREWEVVEAKEMTRVTEGRIATIKKLERLIRENALEVPTLHGFLREFPWVLDPRWTMVSDEVRYSQLLRDEFPEGDVPEQDRRIDFLCVRESEQLIVVEIKRPHVAASLKELGQIEEYVHFVRRIIRDTTDPALRVRKVIGYLLCGDVTANSSEKRAGLEAQEVYVRRYSDLLGMVERSHKEFLDKYEALRKARQPPTAMAVPPSAVRRAAAETSTAESRPGSGRSAAGPQ